MCEPGCTPAAAAVRSPAGWPTSLLTVVSYVMPYRRLLRYPGLLAENRSSFLFASPQCAVEIRHVAPAAPMLRPGRNEYHGVRQPVEA
jgi:hypothetical protein